MSAARPTSSGTGSQPLRTSRSTSPSTGTARRSAAPAAGATSTTEVTIRGRRYFELIAPVGGTKIATAMGLNQGSPGPVADNATPAPSAGTTLGFVRLGMTLDRQQQQFRKHLVGALSVIALLIGLKAGRLCGTCAEDQPVRRALGDRAPIQGRLADLALGGGGGRQPGLATKQPVSQLLPAPGGSPRKEPSEVGGRPQALDLLLAHALAQSGLLTTHCR